MKTWQFLVIVGLLLRNLHDDGGPLEWDWAHYRGPVPALTGVACLIVGTLSWPSRSLGMSDVLEAAASEADGLAAIYEHAALTAAARGETEAFRTWRAAAAVARSHVHLYQTAARLIADRVPSAAGSNVVPLRRPATEGATP